MNYEEIGKVIFGLRVGKHIVFYRMAEAGAIEILRILHQRMDLKNRLDDQDFAQQGMAKSRAEAMLWL